MELSRSMAFTKDQPKNDDEGNSNQRANDNEAAFETRFVPGIDGWRRHWGDGSRLGRARDQDCVLAGVGMCLGLQFH